MKLRHLNTFLQFRLLLHEPHCTTIVQALTTLKNCAKDDIEKTYWIYLTEKVVDHFEKKHVLEIIPFTIFAKNIKQKDLVFALLN